MMLHSNSLNHLKTEIAMDSGDQNIGDSALTSSISSEEPNGSTDRSSASPSNADDLMEDEVNGHKEEDESLLRTRVTAIETKIDCIHHQLTAIMRHLHTPPCDCPNCAKIHMNGRKETHHHSEPSGMLLKLFPNASPQQLKALLDLSKLNKQPAAAAQSMIKITSDTSTASAAAADADLKLGQMYASTNGGGKMHVSETSTMRKTQRKTPFAPPVSSYYQKKEAAAAAAAANLQIPPTPPPLSTMRTSSTSSTTTAAPSAPGSIPTTPTVLSSQMTFPQSATAATTNNSTSPGPSSIDGEDHGETTATMPNEMAAAGSTAAGANLFTQSMVDMLKLNAQNAAHSTGSPGFLRGRGRGRPKLIGDELDADLVDYMVSLKNADPHGGHFTASQALHMARQYILERAPGLLEEHGGHVKLKLTWAMKLVSRIGERQKEIELGLPAGTLSNMGRNLTNLPGGNFMADVMAQNLFSQHMMMVNQQMKTSTTTSSASSSGAAPEARGASAPAKEEVNGNNGFHQNAENLDLAGQHEAAVASSASSSSSASLSAISSSIPEIVNIKELNIPFLNNFLAELNEKNSQAMVIDGEIDGDDSQFIFDA